MCCYSCWHTPGGRLRSPSLASVTCSRQLSLVLAQSGGEAGNAHGSPHDFRNRCTSLGAARKFKGNGQSSASRKSTEYCYKPQHRRSFSLWLPLSAVWFHAHNVDYRNKWAPSPQTKPACDVVAVRRTHRHRQLAGSSPGLPLRLTLLLRRPPAPGCAASLSHPEPFPALPFCFPSALVSRTQTYAAQMRVISKSANKMCANRSNFFSMAWAEVEVKKGRDPSN